MIRSLPLLAPDTAFSGVDPFEPLHNVGEGEFSQISIELVVTKLFFGLI